MKLLQLILVITSSLVCATELYGKSSKKSTKQEKVDEDKDFVTTSKTNYDFSETMIEGRVTAPKGFFLQGRQSQSLSPLVKLRDNFRHELKSTTDSVQSAVK